MLLTKLSKIINYAVCTALLPFVIMLYQYHRNIMYLSFWQVLIFCLAVSAILLVIYFVTSYITRSAFGAFLFCSVLFASFFMFIMLSGIFARMVNPLQISESSIQRLANASQYINAFIIAASVALLLKRVKGFKTGKLGCIIQNDLELKKTDSDESSYFHLKVKASPAVILAAVVLFFIIRRLFNSFFGLFPRLTTMDLLFFGCAVFFALTVSFVCWRFREKLKSKALVSVVFVLISVMIMQSIAGIIMFAVQQQSDDVFYRDSFNIDPTKQSHPNIYWFHTDGMLGFDSMSRFFGDDQEEFARELESRGFWFNRESALIANHSTQWAVPALMSPFFYDRVLAWELDPEWAYANPMNADLLASPAMRLQPNFTSLRIARERNETIMVFNEAGFNTSTVYSDVGIFFYPTVDQFYAVNRTDALLTTTRSIQETMAFTNRVSNLRELVDLLSRISPIPDSMDRPSNMRHHFNRLYANWFTSSHLERRAELFPEIAMDNNSRTRLEYYNMRADGMLDVLDRPGPRFMFLDFHMTHRPFDLDEHGNMDPVGAMNDPFRYPGHHRFSTRSLLSFIDLLLEHDPDAIIILQADHGLHSLPDDPGRQALAELFSCTLEEVEALWDQVMSAVRLPENMMTEEVFEILSDPRNISRFLINTYIGWNYEYIPTEFRQVSRGPER